MRYAHIVYICFLCFSAPAGMALADTNITAYPGNNLQALIDGCSNPGPANVYNIVLNPGTYDQTTFLVNHGGIYGIQTRPYVNIKGATLDRSLYTIKVERPNGSINDGLYETVTLNSNSILQNLTITIKNGRYPVHLNLTTQNVSASITNCRLEHYGCFLSDGVTYGGWSSVNWVSFSGLGVSFSSGASLTVSDSTIVGRGMGASVGGHNNAIASVASTFTISNTRLMQPDGGASITLQNIGSGKHDILSLSSSSILDGPIVYEDYPWSGSSNDHNEWVIVSDGTVDIPWFQYHVIGGTDFSYRPIFSETAVPFYNNSGSTIVLGSATTLNGSGNIRAMTSSDHPYDFAGFAVRSISSGTIGYVYSGNARFSDKDVYRVAEDLSSGNKLRVDESLPGRIKKSGTRSVARYAAVWPWWHDYTTLLSGTFGYGSAETGMVFSDYVTWGIDGLGNGGRTASASSNGRIKNLR